MRFETINLDPYKEGDFVVEAPMIFSIVFLIVCCFYFFFGIYILYINPKENINRSFFCHYDCFIYLVFWLFNVHLCTNYGKLFAVETFFCVWMEHLFLRVFNIHILFNPIMRENTKSGTFRLQYLACSICWYFHFQAMLQLTIILFIPNLDG